MKTNCPKICPACKDTINFKNIPANDYLLELQGTEAALLLLKGWHCKNNKNQTVIFGTVIRYKISGKIIDQISPDHTYVIFPGDKYTII